MKQGIVAVITLLAAIVALSSVARANPQAKVPNSDLKLSLEHLEVQAKPMHISQKSMTGLVIVIDPGKGGKATGTTGLAGLREKDVNLSIAKALAKVLQKNGFQAILTRDSDRFLDLLSRVKIAEEAKATVFISIQTNSVDDRPDVNGLETYYYDNTSLKLAQVIHNSIIQKVNSLKDRGIRKARFYVLRKNSMPAIVVETGYISGREDSAQLKNPEYQNKIADAITQGVIKYLNVKSSYRQG